MPSPWRQLGPWPGALEGGWPDTWDRWCQDTPPPDGIRTHRPRWCQDTNRWRQETHPHLPKSPPLLPPAMATPSINTTSACDPQHPRWSADFPHTHHPQTPPEPAIPITAWWCQEAHTPSSHHQPPMTTPPNSHTPHGHCLSLQSLTSPMVSWHPTHTPTDTAWAHNPQHPHWSAVFPTPHSVVAPPNRVVMTSQPLECWLAAILKWGNGKSGTCNTT